MRSSRLTPVATATLALALLFGAPLLGAELRGTAYGAGGERFDLRAGKYGELFPNGHEGVAAGTDVLALEVNADEVVTRYLVPRTDGPEVEGEVVLVYAADIRRLFVLWESHTDPILSELNLASFAGGAWSDVIEISGDPIPLKGPPRAEITRDPYGAGFAAGTRTVLHVAWWESTTTEEQIFFYTPVVLLGGTYLGWNPVLPLREFAPAGAAASGAEAPDDELLSAAAVEPGGDALSVIATVPLRTLGRLVTFEIRMLPYSLLDVADEARTRINAFGGRSTSRRVSDLADELDRALKAKQTSLHAGILAYLADQGRNLILEHGETFEEGELDGIGDAVRYQILDSGASIVGHGLKPRPGSGCNLVHLGATNEATPVNSRHQLEICLVANLPLPEIGRGPVTLMASETASQVLVVWQPRTDLLRYRLSEGSGWSATRNTSLGENLDVDAALEYLRRLVRAR